MKKLKICKVKGCKRKHWSLDYCKSHYAQFKKYGKIKSVNIRDNTIPRFCIINRCNLKYYAKGYCMAHYAQFKKHGKIKSIKIRDNTIPRFCSVKGCNNKHVSKGYCGRHYKQINMFGRIRDDEIDRTKFNIKGGRLRINNTWTPKNMNEGYIDASGRFRVYLPTHPRAGKNGYVLRAIVHYEYFNNDTVTKEFNIHHEDKDRLNDSKENLKKMTHSAHSKLHHKPVFTKMVCKICKKEFKILKWRTAEKGANRGKYCSQDCFKKRIVSSKTRKKMSQSHKINRGSMKHEFCIQCKSTKYKHIGKGLCNSCYQKKYRGVQN